MRPDFSLNRVFDISSPYVGCSEGLDAFIFSGYFFFFPLSEWDAQKV